MKPLETDCLSFEGMCAALERIDAATGRISQVRFFSDMSGVISVGLQEHKRGNFRDSAEFWIAVDEIIQEETQ